jgi:hypothetical protein
MIMAGLRVQVSDTLQAWKATDRRPALPNRWRRAERLDDLAPRHRTVKDASMYFWERRVESNGLRHGMSVVTFVRDKQALAVRGCRFRCC